MNIIRSLHRNVLHDDASLHFCPGQNILAQGGNYNAWLCFDLFRFVQEKLTELTNARMAVKMATLWIILGIKKKKCT